MQLWKCDDMNVITHNLSSDEHLVMTTFKERERIIQCGLKRYLSNVAGEYFTEEEIMRFIKMLQNFRQRPEHLSFSRNLCICVTSSEVLKNRYIPRKRMRKDELAALIYSVAPYALLTRRQAAAMAKCAFPNFLASEGTINSTFTKFNSSACSLSSRPMSLVASSLPNMTTDELEKMLYDYGKLIEQK